MPDPTLLRASASERVLFRGIFTVALATLLFEIALIRVLSFTIWYHFAYVVISTALLGFGASGTYLAVRPGTGSSDLRKTLARQSLAAGLAALGCLFFVAWVPLNPMRILSEPGQLIRLLLYQLVATVPFFFSGLTISLALRKAARRVDRLYFWDLVGAGIGCALAVPLMNAMTPPGAVLLAGGIFALAASLFAPSRSLRAAGLVAALGLALAGQWGAQLSFTPARSKQLAQQVNALAYESTFSRWTALFRTDLLEATDATPERSNRQEWGLSPLVTDPVQRPCCYIHHDGTAGTGIYDLRQGRLDHLDRHILRLPYLLAKPEPRVLVIGVGGGRDVLTALRYGASQVTGVELDPVTVDVVRDLLPERTQGAFGRPEVELVAAEGRHYVRTTGRRFDLIQITGVDTLSAQTSGAYVLAENYLYTVEAFHDYLDLLEPGGLLSVTTGHTLDRAPREAGRMVSVARRALLERGAEEPARHIAVIDSNRMYADVLVSPTPLSDAQIGSIQQFASAQGFQVLHLSDTPSHPVFSRLAGPDGKARKRALESLPFLVDSIRDDSPFFFRFFRWSDLSRVRNLAPSHVTALGQIVLLVLLVSLSLLGALFVLAPLAVFRRRGLAGAGRRHLAILFYFTAVGLGFMLFEISLMQRFVLYLGYPTYSLSVVLFSLLIFLGAGSFLSRRWVGREHLALPLGVAAIGLLAAFYMLGLPRVQEATLGLPLALRVSITVATLAPLGLVLGIFFPLGIRCAEAIHPDLVPWAWGINGCASVTATVLAVVLAMSFGFALVWMLSLAIYALGVAALLWLALDRRDAPGPLVPGRTETPPSA